MGILEIGLAAIIIVNVIRALPHVERWQRKGIKPFACHACMSFWCSLIAYGVMMWTRGYALSTFMSFLGGAGFCYLGLRWLDTKLPPPPVIP